MEYSITLPADKLKQVCQNTIDSVHRVRQKSEAKTVHLSRRNRRKWWMFGPIETETNAQVRRRLAQNDVLPSCLAGQMYIRALTLRGMCELLAPGSQITIPLEWADSLLFPGSTITLESELTDWLMEHGIDERHEDPNSTTLVKKEVCHE